MPNDFQNRHPGSLDSKPKVKSQKLPWLFVDAWIDEVPRSHRGCSAEEA